MTCRDRYADMKKTNFHEKGAEIKEIQDTFLYPCLFWSKKKKPHKYFPLIFNYFLCGKNIQNIYCLNHFEVCNPVSWSRFTLLCKHCHYLFPEHFHHPQQSSFVWHLINRTWAKNWMWASRKFKQTPVKQTRHICAHTFPKGRAGGQIAHVLKYLRGQYTWPQESESF